MEQIKDREDLINFLEWGVFNAGVDLYTIKERYKPTLGEKGSLEFIAENLPHLLKFIMKLDNKEEFFGINKQTNGK